MTNARARNGRGTLVILTLFLAASGALRVGSGIGTALANSAAEAPAPTADPKACAETPLPWPRPSKPVRHRSLRAKPP